MVKFVILGVLYFSPVLPPGPRSRVLQVVNLEGIVDSYNDRPKTQPAHRRPSKPPHQRGFAMIPTRACTPCMASRPWGLEAKDSPALRASHPQRGEWGRCPAVSRGTEAETQALRCSGATALRPREAAALYLLWAAGDAQREASRCAAAC